MAGVKIVWGIAALLVVCHILETEGFFDIPDYLSQVTHTDVHMPLVHFRQKREALLNNWNYIIDIEVNVSSMLVVGELKTSLTSVSFPIQLNDNINITDVDVSTVCSPVASGFQCQCEDPFVWSLETCTTFQNCSAIVEDTCQCIDAIPPDGPFCQPKNITTTPSPTTPAPPIPVEYIIDIEVNVSDTTVISQLKALLDSVSFPYALNNMISITGANLTTVCSPVASGFQCQCEDPFVWSLETCTTFQNCSAIVEDTCQCIDAIPPDGPFCQPKNITTTPSPTTPAPPIPVEYIIDIEVNVSDTTVISQLKALLDSVSFPYALNNMISITGANLTTVCSPVASGFQCQCEDPFVWSLETCTTFQNCSAIVEDTCQCIDAIPPDGPFCQPKNITTTPSPTTPAPPIPVEYIIDIEVNVSDTTVISQLKALLDSVSFPYALNNMISITGANLTTVCSPVASGFQCQCEDPFVWSLETCTTFQNCSAIVEDTCQCIDAIPPDGPFCQPKNITTTPSPTTPAPPIPVEYIIDIEVNVSDTTVISQLKALLDSVSFPYALNNMISITGANLTTVCSPVASGFQCQCEDPFVWSLETCTTFQNCSAIVEDTCQCIDAIPPDGPFCQPKNITTTPSPTTPGTSPVTSPIPISTEATTTMSTSPASTTTEASTTPPHTTPTTEETTTSPLTSPPSTTFEASTTPPLIASTTQEPTTTMFTSPASTTTEASTTPPRTTPTTQEPTTSPLTSPPSTTFEASTTPPLIASTTQEPTTTMFTSPASTTTEASTTPPRTTPTTQEPTTSSLTSPPSTTFEASTTPPLIASTTQEPTTTMFTSPASTTTEATTSPLTSPPSTTFEATTTHLTIPPSTTSEASTTPPRTTPTTQEPTTSSLTSPPSTTFEASTTPPLIASTTQEPTTTMFTSPASTTTEATTSPLTSPPSTTFEATTTHLTIPTSTTSEASTTPPRTTPTTQEPTTSPLTSPPSTTFEASTTPPLIASTTQEPTTSPLTSPPSTTFEASTTPPLIASTTQEPNITVFTSPASTTFEATTSPLTSPPSTTFEANTTVFSSPASTTSEASTTPPRTIPTTQEPSTTPPPTTPTTPERNITFSPNPPLTTSTQAPSTTPSPTTSTTKEPTVPPPTTKPPVVTSTPVTIVTTTTTATTAATIPPVLTPPPTQSPNSFELQVTFSIIQDFNTQLSDVTSEAYKTLKSVVEKAIDDNYRRNMKGYIGVTNILFRPGSVVTDFTVITENVSSSAVQNSNQEVATTLQKEGYKVDSQSFTAAVTVNRPFSKSLTPVLTGDDVTLTCVAPEGIVNVEGIWNVNGVTVSNNAKYTISNSPARLTVRNVFERDAGTYECMLKDTVVVYRRKEDMQVLSAPQVMLSRSKINSRCGTNQVEVKCRVKSTSPDLSFTVKWLKNDNSLTPVTESTENGFKCYGHNYTTLGECATVQLTCVVTVLQREYKRVPATLEFFNGAIACSNAVYGSGPVGATAEAACPPNQDGALIAECTANGEWKLLEDTCVFSVIKDLQTESEVLIEENLPTFVQVLSEASKEFEENIVNSTVTISTIVNILNTIADVSSTGVQRINKTVMENFLETVNVLVFSEKVLESWKELNTGNGTQNTSTNLIKSIETITGFLSNDSFAIRTSAIALDKTVLSNGFTFNSSDFNTSAQIDIPDPDLPFDPQITTIAFGTLNRVLPPRNKTSINNTINGIIVLVKVNATINNVSLSFEKSNESLANPQCVFWNFTLLDTAGGWDSAGCEVQTNENGTVTCFCDHLTSFSILMSPSIPEAIRIILDFITYIGVGISMGSLVLCLFIEAFVWTVVTRNSTSYMRHVSIVNIALSLLIANIWFMIGAGISDIKKETPVGACSAATFFIHFFYLALFFWMLISGFLLFYRMVMVFSHISKTVMMVISFTVGYGAPLLIAVITVAVTAPQKGYFRERDACWLNWDKTKALLAFVIPALTIVAINFLILIVVLYKMLRRGMGENPQSDERNALVVIARCVAFLTPFFGLTWGFGIGTMAAPQSAGIHIVFAILNSLQGFFVLLFGTILDSRIRAAIAGRFSFVHTSSHRTTSTSAGPSSSSGLNLFRRQRRNMYNVSEAATSSQSTGASESFLNT
ncbi:mucin-17-like isoform X5 [Megalops cyprinoides]|uniref:mucin-17-like isoform X5 n=1 Tax=Megalops cyprinoides TaxID=118141 RepID=UPI00186465C3|nr:mucin-17-like isoform X5 [Megalops cyprinoides]